MARSLHKIMYTSHAVELFSGEELDQLMHGARRKNAHFGVTGCMIYHEGHIIQYLEGPKTSLDFIYPSIADDSRHCDVELLCNENIETRAFKDWTMALRHIPQGALHNYQTVYDLFEDMMETRNVDKLTRQARVFFETFLDVCQLRGGNMGLA
jgi:hypothetical protein